MSKFTNALGIDVGSARIGVARINSIAQIAEPLVVIPSDDKKFETLNRLITEHSIDLVVVGLPRNMNGETTKQTEYVREFTQNFKETCSIEVVFQDETLSTVAAAERTTKTTKNIEDAVAAAVILEDYILTTGV